jgi:hypothetical protein
MNDLFAKLISSKPPWGVYCASLYDPNTFTIPDITGNRDAAFVKGNITQSTFSGNGAVSPICSISGDTNTTIEWPSGSIPSTFTICSITRYTNTASNQYRILRGYNLNWLHGHHSSKRGVAYYASWCTDEISAGNVTDWLVMCGKNVVSGSNYILADGTPRGKSAATPSTNVDILTVNTDSTGVNVTEKSDFAFSQVLIWDQALTDAEMVIVSNVQQQYLIDGIELYDRYFHQVAFSKLLRTKVPWGIYCASSYIPETGILPELTNRRYGATCSGVTLSSVSGNGSAVSIPCITGTTASSITWPSESIPIKFTVCSITRYLNAYNQNIVLTNNSGTTDWWIHGHKYAKKGVSMYKNIDAAQRISTTNTYSKSPLTNWLVMCGKNTDTNEKNNVLVDGVVAGTQPIGVLDASLTMCINGTSGKSDFGFSYVFIWDQELTNTEMNIVSFVLAQYLRDGIELKDKYYTSIMSTDKLFSDLIYKKPPWGVYCASSYDTNAIRDLTGKQGNATCSSVAYTSSSTGNGASASVGIPALSGITTSTITWPTGSIPSIFTICSITRYTNTAGNQKRILRGNTINWLHGHHLLKRGVAYYSTDKWVTDSAETFGNNTDWLVMCGKNVVSDNNYIVADGTPRGLASGVTLTSTTNSLTINNGSIFTGESSDFAFSHVLIWDQALADTEIRIVNDVLRQYLRDGIELKYKYSFFNSGPASVTNTNLLATIPSVIPLSVNLQSNCTERFNDLLYKKPPWGVYCAKSYNETTNTIPDLTGKQGTATCLGVAYTSSSTGNGATVGIPALSGITTSTITWPTGSIPSTFTICSITRYTNTAGNKQRILGSPDQNWLHGHYNDKRGVAHYATFCTSDNTSVASSANSTDWLVMCGKNVVSGANYILANGTPRGILPTGIVLTTSSAISINNTQYTAERSDFAFSHVLIWDQALTDTELILVSNVLRQYLSDGIELSERYNFSFSPKIDTKINTDFCNILISKPPLCIYCANSYASNAIPDLMGICSDATCSGVTYTSSNSGNGAAVSIPALTGSTNNSIVFPNGTIPSTFTICSITRYTNTTDNTQKRILQSSGTTNWFHGHHVGIRGRISYRNDGNYSCDPITSPKTDWLVMCGKNTGATPTNILLDGFPAGIKTGDVRVPDKLTINSGGNSSEYSVFGFSHVLVWDQALTDTEMKTVSDVLLQYLYDGVELVTRYGTYINSASNIKTKIQFNSLLYRKPPWGVYCANSFNATTKTIPDLMGIRGDAVCSANITNSSASGNGAAATIKVLAGNSENTIVWPYGSIPYDFTVCSITRYTNTNTATQKRILQGTKNWLHGHYDNKLGFAYSEGFVTEYYTGISVTKTNWLTMCWSSNNDLSSNSVIANGIDRGTAITNRYIRNRLGINSGAYGQATATPELSDFAFSHVLIWDQGLTASELRIVSNVLNQYLADGKELIENYADFFKYTYKQNLNARFAKLIADRPPLGIYCANSHVIISGTTGAIYDEYRRMPSAISSNITKTTQSGNGAAVSIPVLTGTALNGTIEWPRGSLPSTFTICSITRYNSDANQQRILNGKIRKFFHGHHSGILGRTFYRNTTDSQYTSDHTSNEVDATTNWLVMCGQNAGTVPNNILVNGSSAGALLGSTYSTDSLTINTGNNVTNEKSDFAFSHLLIWDQTLSFSEMETVSDILTQYLKDGIELSTKFAGVFNVRLNFRNLLYTKPPFSVYLPPTGLTTGATVSVLPDLMGKQPDASCNSVTFSINTSNTNGAIASVSSLNGGTAANITWPISSLPSTFTLCTITRYTGSSDRNKIITGTGAISNSTNAISNFIHGHIAGTNGVTTITGVQRNNGYNGDNNWLVHCASSQTVTNKRCIISNGVIDVANTTAANLSFSTGGLQLSINAGTNSSAFAFAAMFVWDTELASNEMITVSRALMNYLYDGSALQNTIVARPYNINYFISTQNVLGNFQVNTTNIPNNTSINYYTKYANYETEFVNTNAPFKELLPYVIGTKTTTNYKVNGTDIGTLYQSVKLPKAQRVWDGGHSSVPPTDSTLAYKIWFEGGFTNGTNFPAETIYFYTVYTSARQLDVYRVKYSVDNTINYIKINGTSIITNVSSTSTRTAIVSSPPIIIGNNTISISVLNTFSFIPIAYLSVAFHDNSDTFLFGTNAENWYCSRTELSYTA